MFGFFFFVLLSSFVFSYSYHSTSVFDSVMLKTNFVSGNAFVSIEGSMFLSVNSLTIPSCENWDRCFIFSFTSNSNAIFWYSDIREDYVANFRKYKFPNELKNENRCLLTYQNNMIGSNLESFSFYLPNSVPASNGITYPPGRYTFSNIGSVIPNWESYYLENYYYMKADLKFELLNDAVVVSSQTKQIVAKDTPISIESDLTNFINSKKTDIENLLKSGVNPDKIKMRIVGTPTDAKCPAVGILEQFIDIKTEVDKLVKTQDCTISYQSGAIISNADEALYSPSEMDVLVVGTLLKHHDNGEEEIIKHFYPSSSLVNTYEDYNYIIAKKVAVPVDLEMQIRHELDRMKDENIDYGTFSAVILGEPIDDECVNGKTGFEHEIISNYIIPKPEEKPTYGDYEPYTNPINKQRYIVDGACDSKITFNKDQQKIYATSDYDYVKIRFIGDNNYRKTTEKVYSMSIDDDEFFGEYIDVEVYDFRIKRFLFFKIGREIKATYKCRLKYDGYFQFDKTNDVNKVVCKEGDELECNYIDENKDEEPIAVIDDSAKINVYQNGAFIKQDSITYKDLLLKGHKVRMYHRISDASLFASDTMSILKSLTLEKHLTKSGGVTNVRVKIKNIPVSLRNKLYVYQIISKKDVLSFNSIRFIDNSDGKRMVLDKDPVIGWYFEDTDSDLEVEYSVDGDNEGGDLIITTEPILFFEGDLVVNYRNDDCNPGEAQVFEIDSLENSNVYLPFSGRNYKICIAHVTDDLIANANEPFINIFNYANAGKVFSSYSQKAVVSAINSTPLYWRVKIAKENPLGTYTCLGSLLNSQETPSTFGDCAFSDNRIWISLVYDVFPPVSSIKIPYIAHTIKFKIESSDLHSGVHSQYVCVLDDDNNCDFRQYYGEDVLLTCPDEWECNKIVRFFAIDNEGNIEDVKEENITLIQEGSACQADCTAKPFPNRYISTCRNMNGCKYASLNGDDGAKIADSCHYSVLDTWVLYNQTHEVKCPNGPYRLKKHTDIMLDLHDSICKNLRRISVPVIINGVPTDMLFVYCKD